MVCDTEPVTPDCFAQMPGNGVRQTQAAVAATRDAAGYPRPDPSPPQSALT